MREIMEKTIYYLGLLANVDNSILNLQLEHGFEVRSMSEQEGYDLLQHLDKEYSGLRFQSRYYNQRCITTDNRKFYYIHNTRVCDIEFEKSQRYIIGSKGQAQFPNSVVEYLSNTVKLMRLFQQGNIRIPFQYFYFYHNDTLRSHEKMWTSLNVQHEPFVIEEGEINELYKFLKETKLPFTQPYLELAYQNFEISYQVRYPYLSLISLIIALEALFNRSRYEIGYSIRRNTAVLLGTSEKESQEIYSDIRKMYSKRSQIVHEGKTNIVNASDVERLRNYVRRAINIVYSMNVDKDTLFNILNARGFGHIN
jgi:hypothetical protein